MACGSAPEPVSTDCPGGNVSGGVCVISCATQDACRAMAIECPAGLPCRVQCSGKNSCKDAVISCADAYPCEVECTGNSGCAGASIACSEDGPCSVLCGAATDACKAAAIECGGNACVCENLGTVLPAQTCGTACDCEVCQ